MELVFAPHEEVVVPEARQRSTVDEGPLAELKESIDRIGLIHPIAVEQLEDGSFKLLAGERRLRACKLLIAENKTVRVGTSAGVPGCVPLIERSQLTDLERYAIELEENIRREDLPWQDKALALARFAELQGKVEPEAATQADVAAKARVSPATVSDAMIVARELAKAVPNPEVAKAGTLKEAVKAVKRAAEAEHRAVLAVNFDMTKSENKLIKGDCRDVLKTFGDRSFNLIIADPPYGVGADSFGDQASTGHNYKDDPEFVWKELMPAAIEQFERVTALDAFMYLFCAYEGFERLKLMVELAGWKVWPRPIIWNKLNNGMVPVPKKGPRYSYECVLYAYKGSRNVVKEASADVLTYAPPKKLEHGAQKPAALYADLLARVALPGDKVLDPFAGSGTVFLAANNLRLQATGIELGDANYNLALTRLTQKVESERIDLAPDLVL